MKVRLPLLLVILLALPLVLAACGGDKVENAEKFLEAMGDLDTDEAKEYACDDMDDEIDEAFEFFGTLDGFDITDIECEEDGDNVKCDFTIVGELEGETISNPIEGQAMAMDGDKVCDTEAIGPQGGE